MLALLWIADTANEHTYQKQKNASNNPGED